MQLQRLVETGNTVVVIEHDMRAVVQADWVMDIGPGAGHEGGNLVAEGTPAQVSLVCESRTAPFIARELSRELVKGQCRHSVNDDTVTLLVYP